LTGVLAALGIAFATVFVAELGDKTQLLTLALATRIRPWPLLAGLTVAIAILCGLAVVVGAILGVSIPSKPVTIAAGVLFLLFGLWTLRSPRSDADAAEEEAVAAQATRSERSQVVAAMGAFFFAELGDKTQLTTLTLATQRNPFGVWLGATLGMLAANVAALVVGRVLGTRLPERPIRLAAAALFLVFGTILLIEGLRQ
jgi:putative Ca2+/H+ antiporter (TMEM165/GDT1 family)